MADEKRGETKEAEEKQQEKAGIRYGWRPGRSQTSSGNGNGAGQPAPTKKKPKPSVFGPPVGSRPDVLTDAETVVFPMLTTAAVRLLRPDLLIGEDDEAPAVTADTVTSSTVNSSTVTSSAVASSTVTANTGAGSPAEVEAAEESETVEDGPETVEDGPETVEDSLKAIERAIAAAEEFLAGLDDPDRYEAELAALDDIEIVPAGPPTIEFPALAPDPVDETADETTDSVVDETAVSAVDEAAVSAEKATFSNETMLVAKPLAVTRTDTPAVAGPASPEPRRSRSRWSRGGGKTALELEPPYIPTKRRTRVSRLILLGILCFQAVLSLRLHNTAFEDEALYLYAGQDELQHLLHGAALQGSYAAYFSGAPVLYPVLAAVLNNIGGLTLARGLSTVEMLMTTALLYSLTRRLFNERAALLAAVMFSVSQAILFIGNFATYDATCLFLLAFGAWIMVRTAGNRWPLFLLAAPVVSLAVAVKYAGALFVPTIALLVVLAGWPILGRRALVRPVLFAIAVAALLYGGLRLGGPLYHDALSSTTTSRAKGTTPVTTLIHETVSWGGLVILLAIIGTIGYTRRVRIEAGEGIGPAGGRFRRLALGVVLTGTAFLAPAYQAHLHTDVSFQKHIGFGLFFAAPLAGVGLARVIGDHFRRPQFGIAFWCTAIVLGMTQSLGMYHVWPDSTTFVAELSSYLKPNARYLVEVPEVPIYYLEGRSDAQPDQFFSTYNIAYINKQGQTLSGTAGYQAAIAAGYFRVVAYNELTTPAVDTTLAAALKASGKYYQAPPVHVSEQGFPVTFTIWVKGHKPVSKTAASKAAKKTAAKKTAAKKTAAKKTA